MKILHILAMTLLGMYANAGGTEKVKKRRRLSRRRLKTICEGDSCNKYDTDDNNVEFLESS